MHNAPLKGKTVVVTGTSKTTTVLSQIISLGGEALSFPLIETSEIIEPDEALQLHLAKTVDWLIFTSQNAVEVFCRKMQRHQWTSSDVYGKIAAVGEKTASLLEDNNFHVSFMPTVFSADVFVKEFPKIAGVQPKCLFIKGSKAKDTLKSGLPFELKEWTVYDTHEDLSNIEPLIELVQSKEETIIIFASPSAVDVFAQNVAPIVGWHSAQLAAIGHITARRIEYYGAKVTYQPKKYTMQAVIEDIQKERE